MKVVNFADGFSSLTPPDVVDYVTQDDFTTHTGNTSNPHSVTKTQVGLSNVPNIDATNPSNITQDSTHRFITDTERTSWNNAIIKKDTYANLLTWVTSAADGLLAYATNTKILYYTSNNTLQEVAVMKTISGTITSGQITVGTSPVRATSDGLTAPNANRKRLMITPISGGNIYLGGSSVGTATGKAIIGPDSLFLDWDASDYYLISDTAGSVVSILEVV